ncbi:MAG: hypothetical protein EPO23_05225 [Xanthobacteraceae bacterium]|nr:MAG: hypothetical protein EPO23_05225 [Xanthobacteraceae bacterium]
MQPQAAAPGPEIVWEVRNRFRLFREERDFQLHAEALRGRTILQSEQVLARGSDGRGWARNTVGRLCIDAGGRVAEPCTRDGVKESYLTPTDHAVTARLTGAAPPGATCTWSIDASESGDASLPAAASCAETVNFRAPYGRVTTLNVDIAVGELPARRVSTEIAVRDLFIAGLGDSIAAGEGNPDRPVALADEGFCFRSYLSTAARQYFRPARAGFQGDKACETKADTSVNPLQAWQRRAAQWLNTACHRSLYSYQARTAIALAVNNPHLAVTYLPLACTGATIDEGLLGSQQARECLISRSGIRCGGAVNGQIAELNEALTAARRRQPERRLDLILLSVGANDIGFSNLVADVIVDGSTERALFRRMGVIGSVEESHAALTRELPRGFAALREALKPFVGGDLSRVVYVSYGNPALTEGGAPCAAGRDGFDIHPSFRADPGRLAAVSHFVQDDFLPRLKSLALCEGGVLCRDPAADRMTFVDAHQLAFASHGVCVRADSDPDFDQDCFSPEGESFQSDPVAGAAKPMLCGRSPREFRAYAPRARWVRSANDSYFAAMSYPQGLPSAMQPADIHDATWGVLSAVYGGAIHPTAEGHAAMADAAVTAVEAVLGVGATPPAPGGAQN